MNLIIDITQTWAVSLCPFSQGLASVWMDPQDHELWSPTVLPLILGVPEKTCSSRFSLLLHKPVTCPVPHPSWTKHSHYSGDRLPASRVSYWRGAREDMGLPRGVGPFTASVYDSCEFRVENTNVIYIRVITGWNLLKQFDQITFCVFIYETESW